MNHNNFYADALLSIDKRFVDDRLSLQFNLGASLMDDKNNGSGFEGHLATLPNKFSLYNIDMSHSQTKPYADRYHDQVQAMYATLQLGWNGMLYLDVTARNEWASQLAGTPDVNIFYPSVGLSAVISEMVELPEWFSFLKLRASYSAVGSSYAAYLTKPYYDYKGQTHEWDSLHRFPNDDLKPEKTKSWEVGLNAASSAASSTSTPRGTVRTPSTRPSNSTPSSTSGYSSVLVQAGQVRNSGLETAAQLP